MFKLARVVSNERQFLKQLAPSTLRLFPSSTSSVPVRFYVEDPLDTKKLDYQQSQLTKEIIDEELERDIYQRHLRNISDRGKEFLNDELAKIYARMLRRIMGMKVSEHFLQRYQEASFDPNPDYLVKRKEEARARAKQLLRDQWRELLKTHPHLKTPPLTEAEYQAKKAAKNQEGQEAQEGKQQQQQEGQQGKEEPKVLGADFFEDPEHEIDFAEVDKIAEENVELDNPYYDVNWNDWLYKQAGKVDIHATFKDANSEHTWYAAYDSYCARLPEACLYHHISYKAKEQLYILHKKNPKKWNMPKLARICGVTLDRIKAVIMIEKYCDQLRQQGHHEDVGYTLADMMEREFPPIHAAMEMDDNETLEVMFNKGHIPHRFEDNHPLFTATGYLYDLHEERGIPTEHTMNSDPTVRKTNVWWVMPDHVDVDAERVKAAGERMPPRTKRSTALDFYEFNDTPDVFDEIQSPRKDLPDRRHSVLFVDTSDPYLPMKIRETNGSLRTASFNERRNLLKKVGVLSSYPRRVQMPPNGFLEKEDS